MLVWIKEGSFNTCLNGSVNEIFEKLSYHCGFLSPPLKDMQKKTGCLKYCNQSLGLGAVNRMPSGSETPGVKSMDVPNARVGEIV